MKILKTVINNGVALNSFYFNSNNFSEDGSIRLCNKLNFTHSHLSNTTFLPVADNHTLVDVEIYRSMTK